MGANSTTYDVGIRFLVDEGQAAQKISTIETKVASLNQTVAGVTRSMRGFDAPFVGGSKVIVESMEVAKGEIREFAMEMQSTKGHASGLNMAMIGVAATAAAGFGLREGKHFLIDFNAEMQSLKINMGVMLQGNSLTKDAAETGDAVERLTAKFQKFAVETPVTTKELVEFSGGIATAVSQAKGGIRDIENVTEQGVIAAKAFGVNSDYAALEITEGITGVATKRMRFIKQLVATVGMDLEKFNHLAGGDNERLQVIQKALNSQAMKDASKKFGASFAGVASTLEDNISLGLGKVGLPLFEAVTAEIGKWNDYIGANINTITNMGDKLGTSIAAGFKVARDVVSYIIEHRTALLAVGGGLLAARMGGGGMFGVGGGGGPLGMQGGLWASVLRGAHGITDQRSHFGSMGANVGMLNWGASGGGLKSILGGELRTIAATGGPSFGDVAGRGAMGFGLAKAVDADAASTAVITVAAGLSALPGPIGLAATALAGFALAANAAGMWLKSVNDTSRERDANIKELANQRGALNTNMLAFSVAAAHRAELEAEQLDRGGKSGISSGVIKMFDDKTGRIAEEVTSRTNAAYEWAKKEGSLTEKGLLDEGSFRDAIKESIPMLGSKEERKARIDEAVEDVAAALRARHSVAGALEASDNQKRTAEEEAKKGKLNKTDVNVRIDKIEVASDDPDRFAFGLIRSFSDYAAHPTQAGNALPGGF